MAFIDLRKDWWTPWEIRWLRKQIVWLVCWLNVLEFGQWPPIPQNEVLAKHKRPQGRAYFETPGQVYAEITTRLEQCGQDAEIAKDCILWEKTPRELCVAYRMDDDRIQRCVNAVVAYCSGNKRRWMDPDRPQTYADFCAHGWIPDSRNFIAEFRGLHG